MENYLAPFRRPAEAGWRAPPDFRALVAFLGTAQEAQPTALCARRLNQDTDVADDIVEALIGIFAPETLAVRSSTVLRGSFNPAVSLSNTPLTRHTPL